MGRDCQEEPVAGATIPIAKQDRLVKRNYKILDTRDRLTSSLKWLNDYEHNDSDEGDRRELVDHAEKTRRMAIRISRKILTATNKKKMEKCQSDDYHKFCPDPSHIPIDHTRRAG